MSVSATVSGGTAAVTVSDSQLDRVISDAGNTGIVTVDVSSLKSADSAKLPAKLLTAASGAEGAEGLSVLLPTGAVALDKTALDSVAAVGRDVTFSVESVKPEALNPAQKSALGDRLDAAVVVDVNVLVNGRKTADFNSGVLTISIPYTPKAGEDTSKLAVWYLADDGGVERVGGRYDAQNKRFVFETDHLSKYALLADPETAEPVNPFNDVAEDSFYHDAVLWAVENGVTTGTSAATFAPNATCTRAEAVTFLWRAMGSPEPTTTANPFTDVSPDAYYYKAVLWAVEQGITAGTGATTFAPDATVTRSQTVTFLWRAAGEPVVNYAMSFTDVAADAYYAEAVRWAVSEGVTQGTGATAFSPVDSCTRAQIVTLLYRYLGK